MFYWCYIDLVFVMNGDTVVLSLKEALPYIKKFHDKVFVVKISGKLIDDFETLNGIAEDVVLLEAVGIKVVVVHGAGQQINVEMEKNGIKPKIIEGLRVTDMETLQIVSKVLGKINKNIVESIKSFKGNAFGIDGIKKSMVIAEKKKSKTDYGFVGEVKSINSKEIKLLFEKNIIPVIACLGKDSKKQIYNINADDVALAVAKYLKAEKLLILSDVPGILANPEDKKTLISEISEKKAKEMISGGMISGGMIPKTLNCLQALKYVNRTHMVDGKEHSLLLEVFTNGGKGTVFVK